MSVLIRGMEMQKGCYLCPCNKDDGFGFFTCGVTHSECDFRNLPSDCPLVPVPPHGRLIDADALMETIREHDYPLRAHFNSTDNGMFTIGIQQAVDEQPTIIPADPTKGEN